MFLKLEVSPQTMDNQALEWIHWQMIWRINNFCLLFELGTCIVNKSFNWIEISNYLSDTQTVIKNDSFVLAFVLSFAQVPDTSCFRCIIGKWYLWLNDAVHNVVGWEDVKNIENSKYMTSQTVVGTIYQIEANSDYRKPSSC